MKISDLPLDDLKRRLRAGTLTLQISPFSARIRSRLASVAEGIAMMYADFAVSDAADFADFEVEVAAPGNLRRWLRPQVNFFFDGVPSFKPLPRDQAYPMLEWGLNWCIGANCHQYLICHAAVIEMNGLAAVLPAPPGAGKSTLCAGLVGRGWRLLSDELALIDLDTLELQPLARPINLKNASIEVIRRDQPHAVMTQPVADTAKGTVALVRPPAESVRRITEPATPAWVIFPSYQPEASAALTPCSKAHTLLRLAEQSFNYDLHGRRGFETVARIIDSCECLEFTYSDFDEAHRVFLKLASAPR